MSDQKTKYKAMKDLPFEWMVKDSDGVIYSFKSEKEFKKFVEENYNLEILPEGARIVFIGKGVSKCHS